MALDSVDQLRILDFLLSVVNSLTVSIIGCFSFRLLEEEKHYTSTSAHLASTVGTSNLVIK